MDPVNRDPAKEAIITIKMGDGNGVGVRWIYGKEEQ